MSDADRLRQAADLMEKRCPCSEHGATVALLRAVADEAFTCWCDDAWTARGLTKPGCPTHDVMSDTACTALDLADAILGGTE